MKTRPAWQQSGLTRDSSSQGLFSAIKRLRFADEDKMLWINAICINQADDVEKMHQVNLMRRTYTQYTECAIWLGNLGQTTQPSDAQIAMETILWIAGATKQTLFTRVAVDLICMSSELIGRGGSWSDLDGLPSWAVNWCGRQAGADFWTQKKRWYEHDYAADRGISRVGDKPSRADERALILTGLYVDKIAVVELREDSTDSQRSTPAILLSEADRWGKLITQLQSWLEP